MSSFSEMNVYTERDDLRRPSCHSLFAVFTFTVQEGGYRLQLLPTGTIVTFTAALKELSISKTLTLVGISAQLLQRCK